MSHTDRPTSPAAPAPNAPDYPWGTQMPAVGQSMPLMAGLRWVRMPLPFALDHINLWVLDDKDEAGPGWTVVDTGVATAAIRQAWEALWTGELAGHPLLRVVATHMHPDHVGNAQWLIERFSGAEPARLWMSATDHLAALLACKETTGYGGERAATYFRSHGLLDEGAAAQIRERGDYYASMVPDVPRTYRRLRDGMTVHIGERAWQCIAGYGHSPEHISLYDARDGVLIAGDMMLPSISTNVSVVDMEPEADPLGLFLDSVRALRALPADTLVLPSHGRPFKGLHDRITALETHHAHRLDDVMACARRAPVSAAELLPVLFRRQLDLHQTTFAMGEAVAHLNHLWHRGQLTRARDSEGVWRFST
ncbi:MBL fold metallo-hydrolase [Aquabacterium fontiphilum]|uniref:MBL fold metallo-hydrolase n=1 Tax=Aquabacterium fontiphilum TaxID=450365 RepID=UPI001378A17E|nr:MBL fold metallo-hydrolase [Aquabacterium fontiphilum]NBD21527.1 MBL fold metallo-hydrolase [Aquabacterium fontiphilum]